MRLSVSVVLSAVLVAIVQGASAADLPIKARPYAPAVVSWAGFYGGLNVGYSSGRSSLADNLACTPAGGCNPLFPVSSLTSDTSVAGWISGGQIGYNYQLQSNIIVGLEADLQWADQKGTATVISPGAVSRGLAPPFTSDQVKLDWFGTVRGRVGAIVNNNLWYVTGGWAYGKLELNSTSTLGPGFGFPAAGTPATFSGTKSGYALGTGVEVPLVGRWTAKLEYLYMKLGTVGGTYNPPGAATTVSADLKDHIGRIGANYRF